MYVYTHIYIYLHTHMYNIHISKRSSYSILAEPLKQPYAYLRLTRPSSPNPYNLNPKP